MMKWEEAITKVLEDAKTSLHYSDITDRIFEKEYREGGGATPAATVNKVISSNISSYKETSPFVKLGRGLFILRKFVDNQDQLLNDVVTETVKGVETQTENNKIINAFGIFWNRNLVSWKSSPDLFGIQYIGASKVNFKEQRGIYLLHDNRETIYVGQAIDQSIGQRLKHHTSDRLSGRWDRFSWFGFYSVDDKEGHLNSCEKFESLDIQALADILEAILIESIEPRLNRKQGNTFSGLEYLQHESPEVKKEKFEQLLRDVKDKLYPTIG